MHVERVVSATATSATRRNSRRNFVLGLAAIALTVAVGVDDTAARPQRKKKKNRGRKRRRRPP